MTEADDFYLTVKKVKHGSWEVASSYQELDCYMYHKEHRTHWPKPAIIWTFALCRW